MQSSLNSSSNYAGVKDHLLRNILLYQYAYKKKKNQKLDGENATRPQAHE